MREGGERKGEMEGGSGERRKGERREGRGGEGEREKEREMKCCCYCSFLLGALIFLPTMSHYVYSIPASINTGRVWVQCVD